MKYRKDIDGLRALAVLPVILFHAHIFGFSGGFVGVDVFFVISGYLITTIILTEKQKNQFSLVRFYERRVRRIAPALFFIMFTTFIASSFWLNPDHFVDFSESLIAVSLFSSNILFWQESGYWGAENELKPLLHTWSLAVEEQYYVLFPLAVSLFWRYGIKVNFIILLLAALASLILSHTLAYTNPTSNFFLLPTRGWELAAGGIIAYYCLYFRTPTPSGHQNKLSEFFSFLGVGLIFYSILTFDSATPFPSLYALFPTIGAALIILHSNESNVVGKVLSSKPFVGIGLISYSAYLWHQPIFALLRHMSLGKPSPAVFLLGSSLSLILAYVTWKFIEEPIRRNSTFSRKTIFSFFFIGSLLFIVLGLIGIKLSGFPGRYPEAIADIARMQGQLVNQERHTLKEAICNQRLTPTICGRIDPNKKNILIVGDSHGPDGLNILATAMINANFLIADKGGCPLLHNLNGVSYTYRECDKFNQNRFKEISTVIDQIDVVVISQFISQKRVDEMKKLFTWFDKVALEVVVFGAGPWFHDYLSTLILKYGSLEDIDIVLNQFSNHSQFDASSELERFVLENEGVFINKQEYFCPNNVCKVMTEDGVPILFDSHHLTLDAAKSFGRYIKNNDLVLIETVE